MRTAHSQQLTLFLNALGVLNEWLSDLICVVQRRAGSLLVLHILDVIACLCRRATTAASTSSHVVYDP